MSQKRDVRQEMIEYLMNKPLEVATETVQFMAGIVKARARLLEKQGIRPAATKAQTPKAQGAPRPPSRTAQVREAQAREALEGADSGASQSEEGGGMFPVS